MSMTATETLERAARRTWDVAVVGAGPAGSVAAFALARRGATVLLVDRAPFPRWKVCGCCLNGRALATLQAVGLGGVASRDGAWPLQALCLAAGGKMARIAVAGVVLSRETFDAALARAAIDVGAAFLPDTLAMLGEEASHGRSLLLRNGTTVAPLNARIILAADGLGGNLLARAGLGEAPPRNGARIGAGAVLAEAPGFYEPGTVFMACGRGGYLGLVRLEDGRLNLAAALDAGFVRGVGGPGAASARLLAEVGWPEPSRLEAAPWRGTPALTRRPARVAARRVFVLGDAAGYVEPFTGEGMAWALESAAAVVPIALQAIAAWRPELAAAWTARHRRAIGRRLVCRTAAAVLRRPRLVRGLVALLGHLPDLAAPVIRRLNGPHASRLACRFAPDSYPLAPS